MKTYLVMQYVAVLLSIFASVISAEQIDLGTVSVNGLNLKHRAQYVWTEKVIPKGITVQIRCVRPTAKEQSSFYVGYGNEVKNEILKNFDPVLGAVYEWKTVKAGNVSLGQIGGTAHGIRFSTEMNLKQEKIPFYRVEFEDDLVLDISFGLPFFDVDTIPLASFFSEEDTKNAGLEKLSPFELEWLRERVQRVYENARIDSGERTASKDVSEKGSIPPKAPKEDATKFIHISRTTRSGLVSVWARNTHSSRTISATIGQRGFVIAPQEKRRIRSGTTQSGVQTPSVESARFTN